MFPQTGYPEPILLMYRGLPVSFNIQVNYMKTPDKLIFFVTLDMKGCICHLVKWAIHPLISEKTKSLFKIFTNLSKVCYYKEVCK